MDSVMWGWLLLGMIMLGNLWMSIGLVMNLLKKIDRLEDRLMCMSEMYPHAAMIELQKRGLELQAQSMNHTAPDRVPDWMTQEASG